MYSDDTQEDVRYCFLLPQVLSWGLVLNMRLKAWLLYSLLRKEVVLDEDLREEVLTSEEDRMELMLLKVDYRFRQLWVVEVLCCYSKALAQRQVVEEAACPIVFE